MFEHLTAAQAKEILKQIRPHLAGLIPLLGSGFPILEQGGEQLTGQELRKILQDDYGVDLLSYYGEDSRYFKQEELQIILNGFQIVATRLHEQWIDCTGNKELYSAEEIFRQVFSSPLNLYYQPDRSSSATDLVPEGVGTYSHRIYFDDSAFEIETTDERRRIIGENVIIHELGHAFHDALGIVDGFYADGASAEATIYGTITIGDDTYTQATVKVKKNTPQVIIDFWQATQSYWSGLDFGYNRVDADKNSIGPFTHDEARENPMIIPLTKAVYEKFITGSPLPDWEGQPCEGCNDPNTLVTEVGGCIRRTVGDDSICITLDNAHLHGVIPIYVRDPNVTFEPNYPDEEIYKIEIDVDGEPLYHGNLYENEMREDDPSPKEGFADTFLTHIRSSEGVSGVLPEGEPRRQFFEENFCDWLRALIGDS